MFEPSKSRRKSRSLPLLVVARTSESMITSASRSVRSGGFRQHALLCSEQLHDAHPAEVRELVELLAPEGSALARSLKLDELALARHHHVHVDLGPRVFVVGQVEQRAAVDDADADRGHGLGDGAFLDEA